MPLSQLLESRCRDLQAELADARRTIDALRHSEEKFRRILANMPDATWTSDQYGRMTYLSPKVEGLFGYSSEEVRASGGDLWLGRVHPEDSGRVLQAYWALFENRSTFDEEYRILRKNGTWIRVHDRAIRTHEENGVLYADGIFCDVTARKLAEEELRSKTAFLEAQANSTIDGIPVVDDRGQRILQSQKFVEMFGIPSDIAADPDDRRALGFVVSVVKDAESFLARVQCLYSRPNETSRDEIEFKNGTILDRYSSPVVDKNGKHSGRIWTFRDITERKRNEDMLQQLSMAVEQSAVSVVITDPQGNISYVNRKFMEVTGYTANEVLGKNPRVLSSGRCAPETYKELWSAITQGREWRGEFCNRRKNGDIFWEAATITPIIDPKGLITHFLAIKEDITERRVLESQLRQAQKLEGIGQLAAGIPTKSMPPRSSSLTISLSCVIPGRLSTTCSSTIGVRFTMRRGSFRPRHADLQSAIGAVNEGRIFRFLTKPCEADVLKKALITWLVQYRLVTAEKELLENTLMGAIKVLTDVLSLANPAAFSRAIRIRRYVQHVVAELKLETP